MLKKSRKVKKGLMWAVIDLGYFKKAYGDLWTWF